MSQSLQNETRSDVPNYLTTDSQGQRTYRAATPTKTQGQTQKGAYDKPLIWLVTRSRKWGKLLRHFWGILLRH
jgi:hypothetical protein